MTTSEPIATLPEEIPQLFAEAWNGRDARQLSMLFVEDAEFVNVVGLWWHDREAIFQAHEYGLKVIFKDSELELIRIKLKYLAEDIAVVHAKMKLTGQSPHIGTTEKQPSMKEPGVRRNLFTMVTQKIKDRWLVIAAHNNDIIPGAETNLMSGGSLKAVDYRKNGSQ